jgi:hypothetical protein
MAADSIAIRFAIDDQPITADRLMLQCYSSCARGLPAAAEEWDVSGLMVEGGVQRQTVVDYVKAISKHLNNEVLIAEDDSEGPAAVTLARLARLLAFADAVGSSRGLLLALDAEAAAGRLVTDVQLRSPSSCSWASVTTLVNQIYGSGSLSQRQEVSCMMRSLALPTAQRTS